MFFEHTLSYQLKGTPFIPDDFCNTQPLQPATQSFTTQKAIDTWTLGQQQ